MGPPSRRSTSGSRREKKMKQPTSTTKWHQLIGPLLVLGLWELLSRLGLLRETFFPPPSRIVGHLGILFDADSSLGGDVLVTVYRVLITVGIAALLGTAFGLAITASRWTENGFSV